MASRNAAVTCSSLTCGVVHRAGGVTPAPNPRMAMLYDLAKALDLYLQPPTNTWSPTLNSEEPVNVAEGDVVEFRFNV